jgi:two-component system phosphate regulon response regulator PhoB
MSAQLLVVQPDAALAELFGLNLARAGHAVVRLADAETALLRLEGEDLPGLLLLEWDLPGHSGIDLLRRIRAGARTRALPVIMVSDRDAEADKVLALESGADDYLTRPCGLREMIARVHALLRRHQPAAADTVQLAGLRLEPATQRVTAGSRQLSLSRVEFRLLNFLMHHPERVHSRAHLLDQVWGRAVYLDERTVDTHVGRLRNALQPSGHQEHIETVRGSGYRFVAWDAARARWPRTAAAGGWSRAAASPPASRSTRCA